MLPFPRRRQNAEGTCADTCEFLSAASRCAFRILYSKRLIEQRKSFGLSQASGPFFGLICMGAGGAYQNAWHFVMHGARSCIPKCLAFCYALHGGGNPVHAYQPNLRTLAFWRPCRAQSSRPSAPLGSV